jgi:hypothetical protein
MIKKKYIVAGNYEQYVSYVNNKRKDISNSNTDYLYVNSVRDLIGLSNIEGYYIGTYYMREDISKIQDRIAILKRIQDNDIEINQLTDRINANKEVDNKNEYSVEHYFHIGNGRYVAKKDFVEQYTPAEDSVYGNVTGYKRKHTDKIE